MVVTSLFVGVVLDINFLYPERRSIFATTRCTILATYKTDTERSGTGQAGSFVVIRA